MQPEEASELTSFKEMHHAPSLLLGVSSLQAMERRPGRMLPLKSISSPRRAHSQLMVLPRLEEASEGRGQRKVDKEVECNHFLVLQKGIIISAVHPSLTSLIGPEKALKILIIIG